MIAITRNAVCIWSCGRCPLLLFPPMFRDDLVLRRGSVEQVVLWAIKECEEKVCTFIQQL